MAHNNSESDSTSSSSSSEGEEESSTTVKVLNPQPPSSSFGSIAVQSSSNVHFGNTTVYNGAVTLHQFITTSQVPEVPVIHEENLVRSADNSNLTSGDSVQEDRKHKNFTEQLSEKSEIVKKSVGDLTVGCGGVRCARRRTCMLMVAVSLAVVVLTLVLRFINTGAVNESYQNSTSKPPEFLNTDMTILKGTEGVAPLYSRLDWLAKPAVESGDYHFTKQPVSLVIISHSVYNSCYTHTQCVQQVLKIQTLHMNKSWPDIGYNFMVGGDGGAYVGRGWDLSGAHTYSFNNRSIGICFLGTFVTQVPPEKQMRAARLLMEEGVRLGKISEDYKLLAHCQVSPTESPGAALYKELKKWPHFAPNFKGPPGARCQNLKL